MERNQCYRGRKVYRIKNGKIDPVLIDSVNDQIPYCQIRICSNGKQDLISLSELYKTESEAAKNMELML